MFGLFSTPFAYDSEPPIESVLKAIDEMEQKRPPGQRLTPEKRAELADLSPAGAMAAYASGGKVTEFSALANTPLSEDEAKTLGKLMLKVEKAGEAQGVRHGSISVTDSEGNVRMAEPKELSAYLQEMARKNKVIPVDQWLKNNNLSLTSEGEKVENGGEVLNVETKAGMPRIVSNGKKTRPMAGGVYGGVVGTKSHDGDELDFYMTNEIYNRVKEGEPYRGKVFVMQQSRKGDGEMKVGFAASREEFRDMMVSTWDNPADFARQNEGQYAELTYEQYEKLKMALEENPKITLQEFAQMDGNIELIDPPAQKSPQQFAAAEVAEHSTPPRTPSVPRTQRAVRL